MTESVHSFAQLLQSAVTEPGTISRAYSAFHGYSIGNQLLAMFQCEARGIPIGPIATFMGWKEKGRHVRKGEKAIQLCMPVTCKRKGEAKADGESDDVTFTRFVYRNNWFVLSQTEGSDVTLPTLPAWDADRALAALDVTRVEFAHPDGNCQGFAKQRSIAVSPVAAMPYKTTFHELAHVMLGHTAEGEHADDELTPRNLCECEAEAVAMLCCAALNLPGVEYSRGYIQSWWGTGNEIPERSAQRILKVADQILKAGTIETAESAVRS
jgi:antirestriction protein ArdC